MDSKDITKEDDKEPDRGGLVGKEKGPKQETQPMRRKCGSVTDSTPLGRRTGKNCVHVRTGDVKNAN